MNTAKRAIIAGAAAAALLAAASWGEPAEGGTAPTTSAQPPVHASTPAKLPRLVDLGAEKCIPCKLMKPVLEKLKRDHAGTFTTEFIDVREQPDAAKPYRIRIIPTQIFFDATGRELFRHEGFFSKEEILAKWKELGVEPSISR